MLKTSLTALKITLLMIIFTGLIYPVIVWGIGQAFFRDKANGSIVTKNGVAVGSMLLAQKFDSPKYFHSRPSATNFGLNSGASNLAESNRTLIDRIGNDIKTLKDENPNEKIPLDMLTTSASGFDPDISIAAALFQVKRIAKARNTTAEKLKEIINQNIERPFLGFNGESRVNVLNLNLILDEKIK